MTKITMKITKEMKMKAYRDATSGWQMEGAASKYQS